MEREPARISSLQAYAFEYATGVLWAMVLVILFAGNRNVSTLLRDASAALAPVAALKFSDTLTAFLIVVAGVVLPYALAMAFRPISLRLMNGLLYLGRRIIPSQRRHIKRDLHVLSIQHLQTALRITSDIDYPELLAFIAAHDYAAAENIESLFNEVVFRAATVVPSALLFTLVAYRVLPIYLSLAIGVTALLSGAAYAIQELSRWRDRAEALAILLTSSEVPAENGQPR